MMKKVLALLLACTMTFSLAACGNDKADSKDPAAGTNQEENKEEPEAKAPEDETKDGEDAKTTVYPEEKVLIGVEIYDPTDSEFLELKGYFDYLSENMNVEFKYSEAIQDADQEMKFIEDCAMAGAKGFMAYYNVTGVEQFNKVVEYEMYYWGGAEDARIYDAAKENPLYLGSVNAGDFEYEAGKAIGEWAVKNGFKKVIYASGGADFGVEMFVKRQQGFLDAVGDEIEVITVSGFPNDQFFADQSAALAQSGVEAVCASFNGVDFWAQPIESAGLKESVKLATVGSVNQSYVDCFADGTLDMVAAKNIQMFALAVPMLCNAVDGNADALKLDGVATNIGAPGWIIDNADDCKKILDAQQNHTILTLDDLLSLCKTVNAEVTPDTLQELVDNTSLESILAK